MSEDRNKKLEEMQKELDSLRKEKDKYKGIVSSLITPVYIIDTKNYNLRILRGDTENENSSFNYKCYEKIRNNPKPCHELGQACPIKIIEKENKPITFEYSNTNPDGTITNSEIQAVPVYNDNGELVEIVQQIFDLTEQQKNYDALYESEAKYKAVISQAAENIYLMEMESYKVLEANQAMLSLLGYTESELKELTIFDFIHHQKEDIIRNIERMKKIDRIFLSHRQYTTKSKEIIDVEVTSSIIKYKGKYTVCVVSRDITQRIKAEKELAKVQNQLEEANKLKSVIISNVSHELRTPLNSILGFTKILLEELPQEEYQETLKLIDKSGKRLFKTIKSLLTLSELESDEFELNLNYIKLYDLVKSSSILFEEYTRNKKVFILERVNDRKIFIRVDEYLIYQILFHLIDNAIKYTEKGYIKIEADCIREGDEIFAVLKVKDTGPGIPEEHFKQIFEAFRQGNEGIDRNYNGIGIGLTIAQKMVTMLGGEIKVESVPKVGSTFTVIFPGYYED